MNMSDVIEDSELNEGKLYESARKSHFQINAQNGSADRHSSEILLRVRDTLINNANTPGWPVMKREEV